MKKRPEPLGPALVDSKDDFEKALGETGGGTYVLRLYVSGLTPRSIRAIEKVRRICAEHLEGRYTLEIIDIHQQPNFAKEAQIVAAPTLVKELPLPLRKFIGDMSSVEKLLLGFDIRKKD